MNKTKPIKSLFMFIVSAVILCSILLLAALRPQAAVYAEKASVDRPPSSTATPEQIKKYKDDIFYISDSFTSSENTVLPYRAYKPFEDKGAMPLIIYLHGRGERGTDNDSQLKYSLIYPYLENANSKFYNAMVVAPQCSVKEFDNGWVDYFTYAGQKEAEGYTSETFKVDNIAESKECKAVMELIEDACKNNNIDRNRIYLMGFSQGAVATWYLLAKHADVFAAAVPISGIGDVTKADIYADIPIYAFHGEKDDTVDYSKGTSVVYEAVNKLGKNKMVFASFKEAMHTDTANLALVYSGNGKELPNLEEWLFAQSKAEEKTGGCKGAIEMSDVALITTALALMGIGVFTAGAIGKKSK